MIQGPISRYGQLGNQLTAQHPFDADNLKYGIQLAMWGYLKKLVIADRRPWQSIPFSTTRPVTAAP